MIQVVEISPQHFRGIIELKLCPDCKNFGICGPNGCGKSGVVDAIEFALTGSITRLTGEGTGGVSLKQHGPHVDSREKPELAAVRMRVLIPFLKREVTIERKILDPKNPKIEPRDPEAIVVLKKLESHPEFALSRREILKYVLTEPGKRSKEVQTLLRLDDLDSVRKSFQTVHNQCEKKLKAKEQDATFAKTRLLTALEIKEFKVDAILCAANERRATLGLAQLTTLEKDTSLKGDLTKSDPAKKPQLKKVEALRDVEKIKALIAAADSDALKKDIGLATEILGKLLLDPSLLQNLRKQKFLLTGYELIENEICPFCDEQWDIEKLKALVTTKLAAAKEAEGLKKGLDRAAVSLSMAIRELRDLLDGAKKSAAIVKLDDEGTAFAAWAESLSALEKGASSFDDISSTLSLLSNGWRQVGPEIGPALDRLKARLEELPDASKEDAARDYLVLCDERLDVYRMAMRDVERCKKRCAEVNAACEAYNESSEKVLLGIYKEVEQDFGRYYQLINHEDEAHFRGKLTPDTGKLNFEVDFYGRGYFPPTAYHSEGHQDGMGLCLYLALMKRILGKEFTFAVLDDVLMSVDAGHRREVGRLLKTEFPDTQFIFTTHDPVWLNQMKVEGMVSNNATVRFRKWSVDGGPRVWNDEEVWDEIRKDLDDDNVPGAAHTLRRYLEFTASELGGRLRAKVEMGSVDGHDLGELLPAIISRWGELLSKGQAAAHAWGQEEQLGKIKLSAEDFKLKCQKANLEQWAVNPNVHFNAWANYQKQDFIPVVDAFRELVEAFGCKICKGLAYVTPLKGEAESLRCGCSTFSINLQKKPK